MFSPHAALLMGEMAHRRERLAEQYARLGNGRQRPSKAAVSSRRRK